LTETPNYVDVHPIGTLTDATSKKLLNFAAILSLPITGARPTQACYWRVERFKLLVGRDLGPTICRREKWKTNPTGARMGGRKSEQTCKSGQGVGVGFYKKARSKTHAVCESMLKSMRNVRKRATFFNFLQVFAGFFRFFHIL